MLKGLSLLISSVLVILISVTAIGLVLGVGLPLLDRLADAALISEAQGNMLILDNLIRQAAAESAGIVKSAQLKITDGVYRTSEESESFDYNLLLRSNFLNKGTFTKEGNLVTIVAGVASASQNSSHLVIENEILEVVLDRVGSRTSFDGINTSTIIKTIRLKDSGTTIVPNDTSVIVEARSNSSWGLGYSELSQEGNNIVRAEAKVHVRSNFTGIEYDVFYTLPASSDFLLVSVRNVTGNKTTVNYAYKIGASNSDILRLGNVNETAFATGSTTTTSESDNQTINLDNTNYTKNSSTLTVGFGDITFVRYNASDGTQRDVAELGEIGQGNWSFSSTSSQGTVNFTLAGSDGYEFGVRDSLPGGSYWINSNGSLYGRINVSNDFITVGLAENNFTVYNSSGKIIFNSSFNDAIKIDNKNLISTYGTGTQNKTVYFYDWAKQDYKIWSRGPVEDKIIEPGLVGWWKFNDGTGNNALDSSGNGNTGTAVNSPDWMNNTSCKLNGCISFDGGSSNDKVVVPDSSSLDIADKITLSAWIKPYQLATERGFLQKDASGDSFAFHTLASANLKVWFAGTDSISPSNSLTTDIWQHVAATYDGSFIKLYINGSLVNSTPKTGLMTINSNSMSIGDTVGASQAFGGAMDNVKIFNRALTSEEVYDEYKHGHMPDWLDPRNKQIFKWRYSFDRADKPSVNITYLLTSHDPFVRSFVDTGQGQTNVLLDTDFIECSTNTCDGKWVGQDLNAQYVDTTNDRLQISDTADGSNDAISFKFNETISNDKFYVRFIYRHVVPTAFDGNIPAVGLSDKNSTLGETQAQDSIGIGFYDDNTDTSTEGAHLGVGDNANVPFNVTSDGLLNTWGSTGTLYYYDLYREGNVAVARKFTDSTYSTVADTQTVVLPSGLQDLSYFKVTNRMGASTPQWDPQITYIFVCNGVSNYSDCDAKSITHNITIPVSLGESKNSISTTQNKTGSYLVTSGGASEEVLFFAQNFKNNTRNFSISKPSNTHFTYNYTFNSTQNQNFLFALGTMGRVDTTNFNPQNNNSAFSNELIESIANSTMTYYNLDDGSLAAWWKFNEGSGTTTADSSGNGITARLLGPPAWISNSTCRSGFGSCLNFSASNVSVNPVPSSLILNNSYTWVVWFKFANTPGADDTLLHIGDIVTSDQLLAFTSTGKLSGSSYFNSASADAISGSTTPSANTWHQAVFVRDQASSKLYLYLDSVQDATPVSLSGPYAHYGSAREVSIGSRGTLVASFFAGHIDNVKVYSRVLSSEEIKADYLATKDNYPNFGTTNQTNGATSAVTPFFFYDGGTVGIWHFDEGGGLSATDASGNGNVGTLVNSPTWITNSSCRFAGCIYFTGGTNNEVTLTSGSIFEPPRITVEAWLKTTSTSTNRAILSKWCTGTTSWILRYGNTVAGDVSFGITTSGNTEPVSKTKINDTNWHHVAGTYDGSKVNIYIDGAMENSLSASGSIASSDERVVIGGADNALCDTNNYNGFVDDARIYSRALTDSEVREHYQREISKYYDDFGTAAYGKTYRYFGVEDSNTTLQPITPKDAVLHLRFNDNSTTNVTDVSGLSNNGRTFNSPVWAVNASCQNNFGGCMMFDGSNDRIEATDSATLEPSDLTIAAWFRPSSVNAFRMFLQKGCISSACGLNGYGMRVTSSAELAGILYVGTNTQVDITSPANLVANRWYHGVLTYDRSNARLYVNGTLVSTVASTGAMDYTGGGQNVKIGAAEDAVNTFIQFFDGPIDEAMIINRSLSADEVYQLYLGGAQRHGGDLVGWWKFNSNVSDTYPDSSGGGFTGNASGAVPLVDGKIGKAVSFRGVSQVNFSDVLDDVFAGQGKKFTLAMWVQPNPAAVETSRPIEKSGEFFLYLKDPTKVPSFLFQDPGSGHMRRVVGSTPISSSGTWYHIVVTYDGTQNGNDGLDRVNIYVDSLVNSKFLEFSIGNVPNITDTSNPLLVGTASWNGLIDNVKIWKRILTQDEITHEYLQTQDQESIYGRIHRVASADDLQSVSYNLTDHNNTFETKDYDMRIVSVNGSETNTTIIPQSPSPACYTLANLSQLYACSYDNSEFSPSKTSAIIYSGDRENFVSICNDKTVSQTSAPYKFNITSFGQTRIILPITNGVCTDIGNKTGIIERQQIPSSPFSSFDLRGPTNLLLSLQYDRIKISGDGRFPAGSHKICVEKVGQDGGRVVVNVTDC